MQLDVEVEAPTIVVPRCTDSSDHMRANLGSLSLSNAVTWALDDGTPEHKVRPQDGAARSVSPLSLTTCGVCWDSILDVLHCLAGGFTASTLWTRQQSRSRSPVQSTNSLLGRTQLWPHTPLHEQP